MRTGRALYCLGITLALLVVFTGTGIRPGAAEPPAGGEALWVAGTPAALKVSDPGGEVLLRIDGLQEARAVSVDSRRRTAWLWAGGALHAYGFDGAPLLWVPVSLPTAEDAELAVLPEDGSVWLAVGNDLWSFSPSGQPLRMVRAADRVESLALDPTEGLLWAGTRRVAAAYDAVTGASVRTIPFEGLRDVDVAPAGEVWIAGKGGLRRHGADGDLLLELPAGDLLHVAATPDGGAWIATGKELTRLGPSGETLLNLKPFEGRGEIVDLIADPGDGSAWVAIHDALARVSPAGGITRPVDVRPPFHIRDLALDSDLIPPTISITAPDPGAFLATRTPSISLTYSDEGNGIDTASLDVRAEGIAFSCQAGEAEATCVPSQPLAEGEHTVTATVRDLADNLSPTAEIRFTVDVTPPSIALSRPVDGQVTTESELAFEGSLGEPASLSLNGSPVAVDGQAFLHGPVPLEEGENAFLLIAMDRAGNTGELALTVTLRPEEPDPTPPDPKDVATPIDPTVASEIAADTEFLYTGGNPVQRGVEPGAIEPRRAAVIRGRVIGRDGDPLEGARISILGHSELGNTLSREDGMFDLAANGGGPLILQYEMEGRLPAQRQVDVPWRDFAWAPDVALIPYDPEATAVVAGSSEIQVARGSAITDEDGSRRSTLLILPGTGAEMVLPDGSVQALPALTLRATEYTVGPKGPEAMPGPLPPTVAYTYAVELSADEAVAAGAKRVSFTRPLVHYVENFLGFPVGGAVPVGYYDHDLASWMASNDGRVVKLLAVVDGLAQLDVTGGGSPASDAALQQLGVTEAERRQLAELYAPGQSLWRAPIPHLTPWDCNWPYGPPDDAQPPKQPEPETDDPEDEPCEQAGSIIECQNQTLGESLPIAGTPYTLNYRSDRVPGRKGNHAIEIPLTGPTVPASLKRIELKIAVAGRLFSAAFSRAPNQRHFFSWDGEDAYGRTLYGRQPATVEVGYVYDGVYQSPTRTADNWAQLSGVPITGNIARQEIVFWQKSRLLIGSWVIPPGDLGGWSLSPHHYYDEGGSYLFFGNGERIHAEPATKTILTVAGQAPGGFGGDGGPATAAKLLSPHGMDIGPDGSLYIADTENKRIRKVTPDGMIQTIAGIGNATCPSFCGPGTPAKQFPLYFPEDVAVAPDGTVYIADFDTVWKIDLNGILRTAYDWREGAISVHGIDVGPDGNLYVADFARNQIIRVEPSRRATVIAGTGTLGSSGDGGPALQANLHRPYDVAVDRVGNVYVSEIGFIFDPANRGIRRISPNGIIRTLAFTKTCGFGGDGGDASLASFCSVASIATGPDGSLYIADSGNLRVRRVATTGIVTTVAGSGLHGDRGDGGPATAAEFRQPNGLAVAPDGTLYVLDQQFNRVRKVGFSLPGYSRQPIIVGSRDGAQLYFFDDSGRHLKTVDTLTGNTVHEFSYAAGRLLSIRDLNGEVTRIERDAAGRPKAIVSPFGIRTELTVDTNGFLESVENPAGETVRLATNADGLLTSMTDPGNGEYAFSYDTLGRLTRDEDPAGGFQNLVRTTTATGHRVDLTSAEGRTRGYTSEDLATGDGKLTVRLPSGAQSVTLSKTDGTTQVTSPDGTVVTSVMKPDPRFGMVAAFPGSVQTRTPAGRTMTISRTIAAALANPSNPLSLQTLQETTVQNGRTVTSVFDTALRRLTITSAEGRQRVIAVDEKGRPTALTFAGLEAVALTYDSRGRLFSVAQGSGGEQRAYQLTYGPDGRLAALLDPLSRTVSLEYDAAGRVLSQVLAGGEALGLSYDAAGDLGSVTPPGRPAHGFDYSPVGLLTEYAPPALGSEEVRTLYSYNLDRQLRRKVRPDGQAVDLDYDTAGRPASLRFSRGQIGYQYSPVTQRLTGVTAPGGQNLAFTYDGFLPLRTTWSGPIAGTVDRAYDNDFRLTSLTVGGTAAVTFAYDRDSLLVRAGTLTLTRNALSGLLTGTTLGRVTTAQTYNGFGEPATLATRLDGAPVLSMSYERDRLGRIVRKDETLGGTTDTYLYTYDPAGRLSTVEKNGVVTSHYDYDPNGNRLARTTPAGTEDAEYDAQDRLLRYGDTTYAYTANGELKSQTRSGQTVAYDYDELGNLRAVDLADGIRIDYLVDGRNRRVGKKVNGVLVQGFLYRDQLEPVAELNGSGQVVALFVYGSQLHVPDYMVKAGRTYRIASDHLGSPRLVIDMGTGEVVQQMDYDEFGRVILDTNPRFQPFGFAGGLYDPHTGFVRFGARDYNPEVGRWTAKDPIGFAGRDTNLYSYALADPVNLLDISGWSAYNSCHCTITVKPEHSGDAIPVGPAQMYSGPVDGISHPERPGEVYKVPTGTDVIAFDGGGVTGLSTTVKSWLAEGLQGWKGKDFLKDLHDKKIPDHGWDALFNASQGELSNSCPVK